MSDGEDEVPVASQPPCPLEKAYIADCKLANAADTRRFWIQGRVNKVENDNVVVIGDRTGSLTVTKTQKCGIGDYVMIIGNIEPPGAQGNKCLRAHQLIPLAEPFREQLWNSEIQLQKIR